MSVLLFGHEAGSGLVGYARRKKGTKKGKHGSVSVSSAEE